MSFKLVRRAGAGPWYMRGTINGIRYDESSRTTDRSLADKYRLKREREIHDEAIFGKAASATFAEAAQHYLDHGGSARYVEPLVKVLGSMPLARIGQSQIDTASDNLYAGTLGSTRNRQAFGPASAILNHAAKLGWCNKPALGRAKTLPGRVRWITHAEADRLLAACSPHLERLVLFLLYTGARMGEALWLEWSEVDLERRQVQFINTKNGTSRGVPLHERVVASLAQDAREGCVFRTHNGSPYSRLRRTDDTSAGTRIKTAFHSACRRTGITDFRPHDCRHTWASWHYQANRDIGALMRLGGWRSTSMVMRYAHTNVEELARTIDAL